MIAYKVVGTCPETGVLVSSWAIGPWSVIYPPGEWAEPSHPNSGLFVFETLKHAMKHLGVAQEYEVWECEVEEPLPVPYSTLSLQLGMFPAYWMEGRSVDLFDRELPQGTQLFRRVKLTKRITQPTLRVESL